MTRLEKAQRFTDGLITLSNDLDLGGGMFAKLLASSLIAVCDAHEVDPLVFFTKSLEQIRKVNAEASS